MISMFKEILEVFGRRKKGLAILLLSLVAFVIVAGLFLKYKTTQSSFCDSCHYMAPYVRHWQSSTHADVDCVDCHDYGTAALTLSAVKYMFGTYNTRPKAIVDNESCLASDCHDNETLDEDQTFRDGILFQHNVHLGRKLRGGELRCTSCHNQIVQYEDEDQGHMAVNDKSCFVCHFKDAGQGEAITDCNSCHGMPEKTVEHAGFEFNHKPYLELDVECNQCHVNIVTGDGAVHEAKCHSCHVERYQDQYSREQLHEIHVTTNGIDCYKCHSDIKHGNFEMVGALDIRCENCHLRQHNQPKQMYMGIGGRASEDMPSEMFTAQVSCTGCHTHITPEGEILARQEKKEASRNSCVTCHGQGYDHMFDNWVTGSKAVLKEYKSFMSAARSDYNNAGGNRKARTGVKATLSKMQANYDFVREGHIPHNIKYSLRLLNSSADDFETAMKAINKSYRAPNRPESIKPEGMCATFCHGSDLIPEEVKYDGTELPHELHVTDMELGCASCHSVTEHGKSKIDESVCSDCH